MRKLTLIPVAIICLFVRVAYGRSPGVSADSLIRINAISNAEQRQKALFFFIQSVFVNVPPDSLKKTKVEMQVLLEKYNGENAAAYAYFIENECLQRTGHFSKAQYPLIRAAEEAGRTQNHYLSYAFLTNLAFLQTYLGNTIDAMSSFRAAKIETVILNDPYLQVVVAINLSDLDYKNDFYSQSLFYLNQAQSIMALHQMKIPRLKNVIDYNIAENYFRTKNADSLEKYEKKLSCDVQVTPNLYKFRQRVRYYVKLVQQNYPDAIQDILRLRDDSLYNFDNEDRQNLADAYYQTGKIDSANKIVNGLLADPVLDNHPEIKLHLYKLLGEIAARQGRPRDAANNFKLAIQQSEDNAGRLTQVGDVISQIKADDMRYSFVKREERFKRERLILLFVVVATLLVIGIFVMIYRNLKQKRYYEKLLFITQKEELAFINSHEIRRHLSNILGIIGLIRNSENPEKEYAQVENYLFEEARKLDNAIKSISSKLDS